MKTRNKALLLMLCAVLLVAASALGTMAYLTAQDEVINTFTVGSVIITMDETDTDSSTPGAERDQENKYHLMPGHKYVKDPIIHVDPESDDCFLFVKVVDEIAAIQADDTIAAQMAKAWKAVEGTSDIFVYVGSADAAAPLAVSGGDDITVFNSFTIKGEIANLSAYKGKTITVTAYAVQADGFESKTASEIWSTAFGA